MKMKNVKRNTETIHNIEEAEHLIYSEEIKKRTEELVREYEEKLKRKQARLTAVANGFKAVFFIPLKIASRVLSWGCRLAGTLLSLGLPYGIYCVYKTVKQLIAGFAFSEIPQTAGLCFFFILPFIAFGTAFIFENLADYFELNM